MTEALLTFSNNGFISSYKSKVTFHWIVILLSTICALSGFVVIYLNKEFNSKSHFTTWHGTLGLYAIILLSIQSIFGVFANYPLLLKPYLTISKVRLCHAFCGITTYILGLATFALGFYSTWYIKNSNYYLSIVQCFTLILCPTLVLKQVIMKYLYKFIR